jgi:osmotically-inducible protein OsmY
MRRIWFALAIAMTGLVLGGTGAMAVADGSAAGVDERQAQQIWKLLRQTPEFENNLIQVDVEDGIAILEGTVDSQQEKEYAQRLAHVGGILGVNNRLKVRSPSR